VNLTERKKLVRDLTAIEGRWPGTDAERRAANLLADRLRALGRQADLEPIYVHPEYSLAIALYCAVAVAASLLSVAVPVAGLGLAAIALFALIGDLTTLFRAGRRIFYRRASQNVVSPGSRPDAPATLVLTAHYDAAKTGFVFSPGRARRAARLHERFRIGPFSAVFASFLLLVATLIARAAGIDAFWLSIVQLIPTAALLVTIVLLLDIALSKTVPGANDNATGVATAISLADELVGSLEHLDVWVVLTGAEEALMEGMVAFMRAHHSDFDRASTYFVNLDSLGIGEPRYALDEGFVIPFGYDERLISICEAIAEADEAGRFNARPARIRFGTDALPARLRGFSATTISCTDADGYIPGYHTPADVPDRLDDAALERAHAFAAEVIGLLDRDLGRMPVTRD